MKILHINSYAFKGTFYKNLTDELNSSHYENFVYVPVSTNDMQDNISFPEYYQTSFCYRNIDRYMYVSKHMKIFRDVQDRYEIDNFDLIHAHSMFSNGLIAYKLHMKYGLPYVVVVRDTDLNLFLRRVFILRKLGRKIARSASKIIFISPSYRDQFISKYIPKVEQVDFLKKSVVLPNGISEFWINNENKPKRINETQLNLLSIGEIVRRKNFLTTIKANDKLNDAGIVSKLHIVGKVTNRKIFKRILSSQNVEYYSPMKKDELISIYRKCDIFVLPSFTETFGLVYPEAMSQGLPVIYSKDQGFDNWFPEGVVGYSADSKDVESVFDAISKTYSKYHEISINVLKNYRKFSWERIGPEYIELYKSIYNTEKT